MNAILSTVAATTCYDGAVLRGICNFTDIIDIVINVLTYVIGAAAIIGFVVCGILYMTDAGTGERIKQAKTWLINIIIGLAAFFLLGSVASLLIPGGWF